MSPILHGMIAWLVAFALSRNVQDRRLIVIAGVIPDIDGIFILFDQAAYNYYHHTFGHSYVLGVMVALAAGMLASEKLRVFGAALLAFSAHLVSDLVGSNWPIKPLYPISLTSLQNPDFLTNAMIYDVINPLAYVLAVVLIMFIAYRWESSPFEFISEKLDRKIQDIFIKPFRDAIEQIKSDSA